MAIIDDQERQLEELRASAAGADLSALQPMAPLPPWAPDAAAQPQPMPDMPTVADKNAVERALEQGPEQPAQETAPAPEQAPAAAPAPKTRKEQLYEAMQGLGDRDAVEKQNDSEVRRAKVGQALYALATGRQLGGDFFAPNVKDPDARLKSELLRSQIAKNLGEQRAAAEGKQKDAAYLAALGGSNRTLIDNLFTNGVIDEQTHKGLSELNTTDPVLTQKSQLTNLAEKARLQRDSQLRQQKAEVDEKIKLARLEMDQLKQRGAAGQRAHTYISAFEQKAGGPDNIALKSAFDVFDGVSGGALTADGKDLLKLSKELAIKQGLGPEQMFFNYTRSLSPKVAEWGADITAKVKEMMGSKGVTAEVAEKMLAQDDPQLQALDTAYKAAKGLYQRAMAGATLTKMEADMINALFKDVVGATPMQKLVAMRVLYAVQLRKLEIAWDPVRASVANDPEARALINNYAKSAKYFMPEEAAETPESQSMYPAIPQPIISKARPAAQASAVAPQAVQAPAQPQQPQLVRVRKADGTTKRVDARNVEAWLAQNPGGSVVQ